MVIPLNNNLYLTRLGIGCNIGSLYVGLVAYADDVLIQAPNRSAAQFMLKVSERIAKSSNISFSLNEDPRKSKTLGRKELSLLTRV